MSQVFRDLTGTFDSSATSHRFVDEVARHGKEGIGCARHNTTGKYTGIWKPVESFSHCLDFFSTRPFSIESGTFKRYVETFRLYKVNLEWGRPILLTYV